MKSPSRCRPCADRQHLLSSSAVFIGCLHLVSSFVVFICCLHLSSSSAVFICLHMSPSVFICCLHLLSSFAVHVRCIHLGSTHDVYRRCLHLSASVVVACPDVFPALMESLASLLSNVTMLPVRAAFNILLYLDRIGPYWTVFGPAEWGMV